MKNNKHIFFILLLLIAVCIMPTNIFAENDSETSNSETPTEIVGCKLKVDTMPTLLENNTTSITRGAVTEMSVNQSFNLPLSTQSGTCKGTGVVKITGSYRVEKVGTAYDVSNISLSPKITSVPTGWTVTISSASYTATSSGRVQVRITYKMQNTNYADCMAGEPIKIDSITVTV